MTTILNTSIITNDGEYSLKTISVDEARDMVSGGFQSAIGHDSTAQIISTILGIDCKTNRIMYSQQAGEKALVFKMNGRPEEGKILSLEELEEIGFTWKKLTRIK